MNITEKISDKFKFAFAAEIITAISGAILIFVLARLLDPEAYGVLFLTISILGMAQLFGEFGIAKSAARYVSEYKEKRPDQVPKIILYSFIVNLIVAIIVCSVMIVFKSNISAQFEAPNLESLLTIGVTFVFFATLFNYSRLILQGLEKIELSSNLTSVNMLLRTVLVLLFVLLGYNVNGALIGYIIPYIFVSMVGIIYLYSKFYKSYDNNSLEQGLIRKIIEYNIPIALTKSSHLLDRRLDTVIVGIMLNPTAVAFYTLSKQVVKFIETPVSALGFTIAPTFGAQKASNNIESVRNIYQDSLTKALSFYIPASVGIIAVSNEFISTFFGQGYIGAVPVLQIMAIYAVFLSVTKISSHGLDYLGRARDRAIVKGITSVLNVGVTIVLIPIFDVSGAAIATVITFSIYSLFTVYIMHLEISINFRSLMKKLIFIIAYSLLIYTVATYILMMGDGLIILLLSILAGIIIWIPLSIHIGLLEIKDIKILF